MLIYRQCTSRMAGIAGRRNYGNAIKAVSHSDDAAQPAYPRACPCFIGFNYYTPIYALHEAKFFFLMHMRYTLLLFVTLYEY